MPPVSGAPPPTRPEGDRLVRAVLVVLVANVATLALELIASRLLAPSVGASLHTWTTIIGVVLAGLSVGNALGGRLADVSTSPRALAGVLGLAALSLLVLVPSVPWLGTTAPLQALPVLARTCVLSLWGFFVPTLLLATVSPLALRLLLPDLAWAGRVAGLLSAVATLGSLLGNFLTGFVLLAHFGVTTIAVGIGLAVGAAALLSLVRAPPPRAPSSRPDPVAHRPEPVVDDEPLSLARHPRFTLLLVATTSFCMLALEVAASRLLAPTLGSSILSWTGIIGVVLVGMMTGNAVGGVWADRRGGQTLLARSLYLSAAACLWVPLAHRLIDARDWFADLGVMSRIVVHAAVVFLPPTFALGTVSPQVLRLALRDVGQAGRTAGRLWATSTLGALVGTFLTGWWLIALVGVPTLVAGVAVGLTLLGALVAGSWRRPRLLVEAVALLVVTASLTSLGLFRSACTTDSDYYCIRFVRGTYEGRHVKAMYLDLLVHTLLDVNEPRYFFYEHENVQTEFIRRAAHRRPDARLLVIGGGGYSLPNWVEDQLPTVGVDVVEIDPEVSRLAYREFGVKPDTRITTYNVDGRQFVQELAHAPYAVIVQDAVNDLSVPFHLMTREYFARVSQLLSDDGVLLVSVIDDVPRGVLLPSALLTLRAAFPYVELVRDVSEGGDGRRVHVLAASRQPLAIDELAPLLQAQGVAASRAVAVPEQEVRRYLKPGSPVLTDEFCPVDTMMAGVFLGRP